MSTTESVEVDNRSEVVRRALIELKAARAEAAEAKRLLTDPVAVVGMGCRLPGGVSDVDGFWDLLVTGRSGVVDVPADRWDADAFFDADPDAPGRTYSRHGGFVDGIREFDAGLFGVPPREAVGIDPQHRFVLEVAWEALEHAGIAPDSLRGTRTGVFVGMGGSDYERLNLSAGDMSALDLYTATGGANNMAANRLSYVLGLEGPSLVVDTACSSSLVAVHLAAQALRAGECDLAIVAGVNTLLSPGTTVALSKARMLSPDGQCKTFDAQANGYVRGEGCGVVVLRRLSEAQDGGQRVWAVVKGSAVNQDGKSSGLTVPQAFAQQRVIRKALEVADVRPADVDFVETHGTGTALGDPIEVRALSAVLGAGRDKPVVLGAVKTNIGHLEAAAGIASLIKAVLVVEHGQVPPNLNLSEPNPYIPWADLPVTVPTKVVPLPPGRRTAGVSSFGFGGTNAHVVLQSAPSEAAPEPERVPGPVVVKVSGRGVDAVRASASRLVSWLDKAGETDLRPIAWTANVARADLSDRAAVVADSVPDLIAGLTAVADGRVATGRRGGSAPRVAFVVPDGDVAAAVALGDRWRSLGVRPDVVVGQGTGAYAAAVLAGVWSLADATRVAEAGADALAGVAMKAPEIDLITDAGGTDVSIVDHWRRQAERPVSLADTVNAALEHELKVVIELGTGDLLSAFPDELTRVASTDLPTAAARVWTAGVDLDWTEVNGARPDRIPVLPSYPFQRQVFWPEHATARSAPSGGGTGLRPQITVAATGDVIGETRVSLGLVPFLDEHRVHGKLVVPGVLFLELVLRTAEHVFPTPANAQDLVVSRSLVLADDDTATIQVVISRPVSGQARARVFSRTGTDEWRQHFETTLHADAAIEPPTGAVAEAAFAVERERCTDVVAQQDFYGHAWHPMFRLGPSFTLVRGARRGPRAAVGTLVPPAPNALGVAAGIRPELLLLDACIQLVAVGALSEDGFDERPVHLGTGYQRMEVGQVDRFDELECVAVLRDGDDGTVLGDLRLYGPGGEQVARIWGAAFRPVAESMLARIVARTDAARPAVNLDEIVASAPPRRREIVQAYLAGALAAVTGATAEAVERDVPVTELADSLMTAELRSDIERDLEITVPMEVFFDGATLISLADWLVAELPESTVEVQPVQVTPARPVKKKRVKDMTVAQMTALAELEPDIRANGEPEPVGVAPDATLLTGATGFVGAFLLDELLKRRDGAVFCLVRANDHGHALRRVLENLDSYGIDPGPHRDRIIPVVGDLAQPLLGLGEQEFAALHGKIGDIVHCGGMVKWTYPYSGLEGPNVAGTREVLRLATVGAPRPVHFISTVGVFSSKDYTADVATEREDLDLAGSLVVGYAQTKWVAERMVRFARDRGVPVSIHRINTGGHSVSGAFNRLDHLTMIIRGCVETGMAPDDLVDMPVQPAPIDYVAAAVVEVAKRPELHGGTFHLANANAMNWKELFDCVEEFGYPLERVTRDAWRSRVTSRNAGTMALLGLAPFLHDSLDHVRLPYFDTTQTTAALAPTGVTCPPLDSALVRTFLGGFVRAGFIDPPAK